LWRDRRCGRLFGGECRKTERAENREDPSFHIVTGLAPISFLRCIRSKEILSAAL
jgi:hypothetical protein